MNRIVLSIFLLILVSVSGSIYVFADAKEYQKMSDSTPVKLIFVIKVTDEKIYREYREMLVPIMQDLNVKLLNEYAIDNVLHSNEEEDQVNLLVVFEFPTKEAKAAFFADQRYIDAKPFFMESATNFSKIVE